MTMRNLIFTLVMISIGTAHGQVKLKDLEGAWTACNDDSLYYKSDTVTLYNDINHRTYQDKPCCHNVNWQMTARGKLRIEELFACTEPGRIKHSNEKESIKLTGKKEQVITLKRGRKVIEKFALLKFEVLEVDRYPHEVKVMALKRL
jgi:hypothetical protein